MLEIARELDSINYLYSVDDIIMVTDTQVIEMMHCILQRMKIIVAVAPAAIFHYVLKVFGKKSCAVISGGNLEPSLFKQWL